MINIGDLHNNYDHEHYMHDEHLHHHEDEKKDKKHDHDTEEKEHANLHKDHDKKHRHHQNNDKYGRHGVCYVSLLLGRWRKQIPHFYRRVIIATALNTCVNKGKFKIYGYLITSKHIFLIFKAQHSEIKHQLRSLKKQLELEIEHYYLKVETNHIISHDVDHKVKKHRFGYLFEMFPLYNDSLVRLLTGRKPKVHYYDSQITKMEDILQNYQFCSVLDYESHKLEKKFGKQSQSDMSFVGSAVKVDVKDKSFWEKHKA